MSLEMIENLNLKILPHVTPYKVSWLNNDQHVLGDEQIYVDFKIGDYKDKLLCDMLPMDSFHLLLGCPWKYDV